MSVFGGEPLYYVIKVQGEIDSRRFHWFDGLEVSQEGDTATLSGFVEDAAALYGLIARARDLGLTLVSISSRKQREATQ